MLKHVYRLTKLYLYVILVITIAAMISLPWMLETYLEWTHDTFIASENYMLFMMIFCYIIGAGAVWILFELIFIVRTLYSNPFVRRNVYALKRIGEIAVTIGLIFAAKNLWYNTPMTWISGWIISTCGLFAIVLYIVFDKAVDYKEETDLVI